MNILKSVVLTVVLASPVAAMAQTTGSPAGSPGGATPVADPDKAERNRPQGGSTAGANGRQDPTIKLSHSPSDNTKASTGMRHSNTSSSDQGGSRAQGGSTAGANGAQDPTIKKDAPAQQPPTSK